MGRKVKKFMEKHYKDRGETVTFRMKRRKDAPLQENGYDCGVFLCQYAERIARRSTLNFSQKDLYLADTRERMTQELLEGRINPDWQMVNWEKQSHYGKQKENEIRSSVGKLGANKKEDSQKETPRAASKG